MFHKKGKSNAAGGAAYPSINPDIFGKLQPEIDAACDEMISSGVKVPTRELVAQMTKRIYESVCGKYPDVAEFARVYNKNFPTVQGQTTSIMGVEVQGDGGFAGLLAFLLLAGFFFRRRRFRRFL